jgi:hypothetical protein
MPRGLTDAEMVEAMESLRSELDAGADLAKCGRLFQDERAKAVAREAERGGEATDAAAGNDDRRLLRSDCHPSPSSEIGSLAADYVLHAAAL